MDANVFKWNGNKYWNDPNGRAETEIYDNQLLKWRRMTSDEHYALNSRNVKTVKETEPPPSYPTIWQTLEFEAVARQLPYEEYLRLHSSIYNAGVALHEDTYKLIADGFKIEMIKNPVRG